MTPEKMREIAEFLLAAAENPERAQWRISEYEGWHKWKGDYIYDANDYRIKPEPIKIWVNVYLESKTLHMSRQYAENFADNAIRVAVPMIEVTDDE